MMYRLPCLFLLLGALACSDPPRGTPKRDAAVDGETPESPDGAMVPADAAPPSDAACASVASEASVSRVPVDIIWVVDNSTSMEPAIRQVQRGLNDFADRIAASGLDYRVIMISLRQGEPAGSRFPICIPRPLAGDDRCGDGERFFHVSVDIKSTQPIEQLLGTLAQSEGYAEGDSRGSRPWRELLRPDATKSIVMVTDDNSRTCEHPNPGGSCQGGAPPLTATSLEDYPGGTNPFSRMRVLGPGIRMDDYGELFAGYTFNAIYGWGAEGDPSVACSYPSGEDAASPGYTYTALVERTGGVRAQICDQADSASWDRFFDALASRVEETSRVACDLRLPEPPEGMSLDPGQVNVSLDAGGTTLIPKVGGPESCVIGGWYYDDDDDPTEVNLCPGTCEDVQGAVREAGEGSVTVLFGCDTLLI